MGGRATGYVAARELRRRAGSLLALAVLLGLGAGAGAGAIAIARRTSTAFPRLADHVEAPDALVNPDDGVPRRSEIEALPEVVSSSELSAKFVLPRIKGVEGDAALGAATVCIDHDEPIGLVQREGRAIDPNRTDEVVVSRVAAKNLGLMVGSRFDVLLPEKVDLDSGEDGDPYELPMQSTTKVTVVGLVEGIDDLVVADRDALPFIRLSPAYCKANEMQPLFGGLYVRLRSGADEGRFVHDVRRIQKGTVFFLTLRGQRASAAQATAPYEATLWVGAAGLLLGVAVIIGQALLRTLRPDQIREQTLSAIGFTRRQRRAAAMLLAAAAGLVAALVGGVVAIALSPLGPVGPAGRYEPDPGWSVDAVVLTALTGGLLLFVVAIGFLAAWRPVGATHEAARQGAMSRWAARRGAGPAAVAGLHAARRGAGPTVGVVAVSALSLAAVVGAAVFGTSADRLAHTPRLYGGDWDLTIDLNRTDVDINEGDGLTQHDVLVRLTKGLPATVALGGEGEVTVGGRATSAIMLEPGGPYPTLVKGRAATGAHEVVLGVKVADRLGLGVGDDVAISGASGTVNARIAGLAVFPRFSSYPGAEHSGLGEGVVLPKSVGNATVVQPGDDRIGGDAFALIRLHPDADEDAVRAVIARRAHRGFDVGEKDAANLATTPGRPDGLLGYTDLGVIPFLLAGALAVVAGGATFHAIVTSVRSRRRELALLKVLGFRRRQVSGTVAWQATALAVQAALIGIPAGVIAGRAGWNRFASSIGVVPTASVPFWIALTAVASILTANAMAYLPGRRAASLAPAEALRQE